jgi:hypothetical protein
MGQCVDGYCSRRRYTRAQEVEKLAVEKYTKNGKGITFNDLLSTGLASYKEQAQITLKYCLRKMVLFTISSHKPQEYYPTSLKSEISKTSILKNIPVGATGVPYNKRPFSYTNAHYDQSNDLCFESIVIQSLEAYVLPMLPAAPLFIHKMQFKLKIDPACYRELDLQ